MSMKLLPVLESLPNTNSQVILVMYIGLTSMLVNQKTQAE